MIVLTKYVGGHSDLMMGAIVANGPFLDKVKYEAFQLGQCSGPDDIYLAARGLRSLHLRLDRSMQSSLQIAEWLSEQPEVSTVIHPARRDHPDHMIYQRDFKGGAGLFCFELKNQPQHSIDRLIDSLELFGIGSSFICFCNHSCIIPPTSHPAQHDQFNKSKFFIFVISK